ncbi:MAG: branched-chain amino acid ABC transporter permease [Deltaproteobacteria bacterium]|nr:branched-chain amino acid ABC transporter permease [Deltaproteobacteria bacterium]
MFLLQGFNTALIIGVLVLVSLGLGIIYGLMNVLNLAHGEFLMLGAYGVVVGNMLGLGVWVGILLGAVSVGIIGYFLERSLISRLYGRPIDALLATWGLSLMFQQAVRLIFGPEPKPVVSPIEGAVEIFGLPFPIYKLVVLIITIGVTLGVLAIFRFPTFGIKTRAVLQDWEMAQCLGIASPPIYSLSFAIGAGLSGLAGGLIAPLITVQPFMGPVFVVRGFLTVIVGGVGTLLGVVGGASVIGGAEGIVAYFGSSVGAQVVVLTIAIIIVRLRPQGIFSRR